MAPGWGPNSTLARWETGADKRGRRSRLEAFDSSAVRLKAPGSFHGPARPHRVRLRDGATGSRWLRPGGGLNPGLRA